jgi:hypothetical protein
MAAAARYSGGIPETRTGGWQLKLTWVLTADGFSGTKIKTAKIIALVFID